MTDYDHWYLDDELNDGSRVYTHLASSGRHYTTEGSVPTSAGWVDTGVDSIPQTSIYMRASVDEASHWFDAYLQARYNHGQMRRLMKHPNPLRSGE